DANTAVGASALRNNTEGGNNTAVGLVALTANTVGNHNTAIGDSALTNNKEGSDNTAVGFQALEHNTTSVGNSGTGNTAIGSSALFSNSTGGGNTALGNGTLSSNTTGILNTALGFQAGTSISTADDVTCIGAGVAGADVSHTTWIGNVFGVQTQNGSTAPVIVSADGQLGTVASSERFKKDIANMEETSEAIMSLRPVTFHYKTDIRETPQFGLIAEEVAKVNPALVLPDKEGKPYTVRYDAVNAMLLNEFLKERRKVEQQEATITQLKSTVAKQEATAAKQQKQIAALTAGLQRVSAQLELSKSAPQTVLTNQ